MENEQFIIFKANQEKLVDPPSSRVGIPYMVLTEFKEDLISGNIYLRGIYCTAELNNGNPSGDIGVINFGNLDLRQIKLDGFTYPMSITEYIALATSVDTSNGVNIWERHRLIKINGVKYILGVNPQYGLLATDWELLNIVENED